MNFHSKVIKFFASLGILLLFPDYIWALQVHPHPEGLIAHEIAHLFFALAMAIFAYRIKKLALERPHWRHIQLAAILLIIWNLWAFGGHLAALKISPEVFWPQENGDYHFCEKKIIVRGWQEGLYYILKNDNLFTLPAFYFLYRGISRMEELLRGKS